MNPGFVATTQAPNQVFEARPRSLYPSAVSYPVPFFILFGTVVAVWR